MSLSSPKYCFSSFEGLSRQTQSSRWFHPYSRKSRTWRTNYSDRLHERYACLQLLLSKTHRYHYYRLQLSLYFVAPWFPLYHQDVSFDLLASVMSDDVLGEYVGKRGLWVALAPWKDFPREVIFMEMTYKYIHRLTLGQNHRHTIGGIHPIIEDQYAGLGLHCKTTMKDICQFHDSHSDLRLNLWILSWTIWNRYVSSYRPKRIAFLLSYYI